MDPGLVQALLHAQQRGVDLVSMPALYEMVRQRVPVDHLPDDWLIGSLLDTVRSRDASRVLKRAADVAGGLAGLVVYAAAWPIIALAIRLGSPGPIHYSQVRVGQAGHPFRLVKFRTMVPDAEANGPRWANANDPRVTRVGRFLRRTRLDELPQVLNVVRGEMSLVGPRPERPEFVAWLEREIPFYGARLMIRPGLTGWAQVNHPYGESMLDAKAKLEYDLYYIKHRSMLFDLRILFRTVWTILRLKGT
jgi:exopolysaccharide biosynthesis polyprenyl glycosylphosphotransferase